MQLIAAIVPNLATNRKGGELSNYTDPLFEMLQASCQKAPEIPQSLQTPSALSLALGTITVSKNQGQSWIGSTSNSGSIYTTCDPG